MLHNRRNWVKKIGLAIAAVSLSKLKSVALPLHPFPQTESKMKLGAFSISLTVKDINASKQFYENLGFTGFAGDMKQNWIIMKNEHIVIGLFQGMFEKNMLTFNPGWDQDARMLESFTDVRKLQQELKAKGIKPVLEADEKTTGPASFMITDPDGNPILFDQHV